MLARLLGATPLQIELTLVRITDHVARNIPWYAVLDRLRYFEGSLRRDNSIQTIVRTTTAIATSTVWVVVAAILVIFMQAGFVVVDEDGSGDMHRITQDKPFLDSTLLNNCFDRRSNVLKRHPCGKVECQVFRM